jgi:lipoprotein-anchoring transpeptidase ErfK/SrfK
MRWLLPVAFVVLALGGAGAWGVSVAVSERGSAQAAAAGAPPQPAAQAPAPSRAAVRCRAGRILPVGGPDRAVAALVLRPTAAREAPGGRVVARFGLINVNGVRTIFSVLERRVDAACRTTWLRVQLPIRPNGSTGWVSARDVKQFTLRTRVLVDLSERRVTLFRAGEPILRARAAIGKPSTPTPTGRYYVNQRLLAENPAGAFGPGGVGISAFSPTLQNWAQGGPIAIHGTDRPDLIGAEVSHGCVRIDNDSLLRLMRLAPEGTPVEIRA